MKFWSLLVLLQPLLLLADDASVSYKVCYDYECGITQDVQLNDREWLHVKSLFSPAAQTPAQERKQIQLAIAQMEKNSGEITGTSADLAGNAEGAGSPKQMDCIDESTNSTTYLALFQQRGWLRWHTVQPRRMRSPWLINIHWTAVIRDTSTLQEYAVDSWFHANGIPPEIIPIEIWQDGWRP